MSGGPIHAALVEAARQWLTKKHAVVITDMVSATGETPDAIGFGAWHSTLVECKASRSDFLADKKKRVRALPRGEMGATSSLPLGMGNYRYYLAPAGLLSEFDMPPNWGLLELQGNGKVTCAKKAECNNGCDAKSEVTLLLSAIRRVARTPLDGLSVKCYTLDTKRTATLSVEPADEVQ